jgi:hypothetical protein
MTSFEQTLLDVDRICRESQTPYAVIGGIAALVHGGMRTTHDVDITIYTEIDQLDRTYRLFEKDFAPIRQEAMAFFERFFVLSLRHRQSQIRVDMAAALSGLEQNAIKRSERRLFGQVEISVCTVEDLLIFKLFAARDKDLLDVKSLVAHNREKLDVAYLRSRAKELILLERSDVLERLETLLQ